MTPTRYAQLERGLNSAARKVLNAIPISKPATVFEVNNEIERMGGTRMPHDVVEGCIAKLVDVDLVKVIGRGQCQRVAVKEPPVSIVSAPPTPKPAPAVPAKPAKPEDQLLGAGDQLRKIATQLENLADALDEAALSIDQRIAAAQAGSEKLKAFKQLLQDL